MHINGIFSKKFSILGVLRTFYHCMFYRHLQFQTLTGFSVCVVRIIFCFWQVLNSNIIWMLTLCLVLLWNGTWRFCHLSIQLQFICRYFKLRYLCPGANRSQIWFCRSVFDSVMSHLFFLRVWIFYIWGFYSISRLLKYSLYSSFYGRCDSVGQRRNYSCHKFFITHICILESLTFRLYQGWVGIWCWDIFNWCRDFYTRTISGGRRWQTRIGFHCIRIRRNIHYISRVEMLTKTSACCFGMLIRWAVVFTFMNHWSHLTWIFLTQKSKRKCSP